MNGIEIRHLRYFLRVAEELHFGRAAEILGISQAPLSQQIRQLEDRVGVRLFDRTTRSVSLTPAGKVLYNHSTQVLANVFEAVDQTRTAAGLNSGRLRIGAMAVAVHRFLPAALANFSQSSHSVRFDLQVQTTEEQLAMLKDHKIDLAFLSPPRSSNGLLIEELFSVGFVAIIPAESPLAGSPTLSLADLIKEDFIGFSEIRGIGYQDVVLQKCADFGFQPRIVQRVSQTAGIVALVAAGLGVGIVPAWVKSQLLDGVVYRDLPELPNSIGVAAAWRAESKNPFVQPFLETCRKVISGTRHGL